MGDEAGAEDVLVEHGTAATLGEATRDALCEGGALARGIPGFVARPAQQRLGDAVAAAFEHGTPLVAEAGTGTGKTYAYLAPALLSGQRVIVSTGTRALQDQLFHRDLPRVRAALGVDAKAALLKGRANYLCWYRLERARSEGRFAAREHVQQLARIHAWSGLTRSGDIAEVEGVPEGSPLWPQVTSTPDNCLGGECPSYGECFVARARQAAQDADLVVVNHHLLFADMAIRQEGFGEILPGAHAFVLDEAHQLPELAAQFFGEHVGARQLNDLARDALAECAEVPGALSVLQEPARTLVQRVRELRLALDPLPNRGALEQALQVDGVAPALAALDAALAGLAEALSPLAEASPGFAAAQARARDQRGRLARIAGGAMDHVGTAHGCDHSDPSLPGQPPRDAVGTDDSPHAVTSRSQPWAAPTEAQDDDTPRIRWFELTQTGFTLHATPLDVAAPLAEFRRRSGASWVFTSATLAVAGSFDHFARQVGLEQPESLLEGSPFDYAAQTLAYLPRGLPEPSSRDYTRAVLEAALPVLDASRGRAFLLFTSHRALREAAEWLPTRCRFPLFVQGTLPRHALLEAFRASGDGVLLGAASFWEGVDVAGEALSLVVIDKLPFAAPDDPVLEARLDAIRRSGGNPFRDWQLPSAVIALKQGAGRLIRTHADRGVLMLCDPRLSAKSYGRVFLDSLPAFPRTRELAEVQEFFALGENAGMDPLLPEAS